MTHSYPDNSTVTQALLTRVPRHEGDGHTEPQPLGIGVLTRCAASLGKDSHTTGISAAAFSDQRSGPRIALGLAIARDVHFWVFNPLEQAIWDELRSQLETGWLSLVLQDDNGGRTFHELDGTSLLSTLARLKRELECAEANETSPQLVAPACFYQWEQELAQGQVVERRFVHLIEFQAPLADED